MNQRSLHRLPLPGLFLTAVTLSLLSCSVKSAPITESSSVSRIAPTAVLGTENGTWAFEPAPDMFSAAALLDLRYLNEKTAGIDGFIRRSPDGNDFVTGKGTLIRFWAVDEYVQETGDDAMLAHKARWLAKRGVNMVRVHTQIAPEGEDSALTDVNEKQIKNIWRLVAAMKKEGIYTTISPYWGVHVKTQKNWNVPGVVPGTELGGLVYFDPTLQRGYRAWINALYTRPNPETGIPLAKDPAVAVIQIQNEDSLLFWTVQSLKGEQLAQLREQFGAYLTKKYGTLAKANAAWGGETPGAGEFQESQGDEFDKGRVGIYIVWHMTQKREGYQQKRLSDQLAFFTETMRNFNASIGAYLKKDLGCVQLVNAGNWRPADPNLLFDAERYSYSANEVMGVNRYFTGAHEGPDNGWAIRVGDTFTNNSVLLDPRGMPTNIKQPTGYPFIIPEVEWVAPSGYQSEGPFLTAAYQSLTGVDISYFFADGDVAEWQIPFAKQPWNPPTGKWSIATPMQLGQFPAAALLFRKGYLRQGKPVVHEERAIEDIWERRSPLIAEEGGYDPNRDSGNLPARSAVKVGVDPLAFLAGPVEVVYGGDPAKNRVVPELTQLVDTKNKIVRSITGEQRLNYDKGICVVNAPKAQGATGFLSRAGGALALSDVTLQSRDEYATVAVVSMDDAPLKASRKVLVQVGTVARPTDWQDELVDKNAPDSRGAKRKVVNTGKNPWQIQKSALTVTVWNPALTTAVVLDGNGMPVRQITLQPAKRAGGNGKTFTFPPDALYVVLK